jgi:hypothetical protein
MSLGDMITECLESIGDLYHAELKSKVFDVVVDTIMVTASAVEDSTPEVRSMRLFAIGDIAYEASKMGNLVEELLEKLSLCQTVVPHTMW